MRFDSMRIAGVLGATILAIAFAVAAAPRARAQGADPKATDQRQGSGDSGKEGAKKAPKPDEYAESEKLLGPAGSPECMWLGTRVVKLLQSDDLDTAFRHLDLYDRFGCPGGHIQVAFRCFVRQQANIDPKALDFINGRIHACWLNPNTDPVITPPAAASAAPPSQAQ
jgi:hypothetical protein